MAYPYLGLFEQHRGGGGGGVRGGVTPPRHSGFPFSLNLPLALGQTQAVTGGLSPPHCTGQMGTRCKTAEPLSWLTLKPGFALILFSLQWCFHCILEADLELAV